MTSRKIYVLTKKDSDSIDNKSEVKQKKLRVEWKKYKPEDVEAGFDRGVKKAKALTIDQIPKEEEARGAILRMLIAAALFLSAIVMIVFMHYANTAFALQRDDLKSNINELKAQVATAKEKQSEAEESLTSEAVASWVTTAIDKGLEVAEVQNNLVNVEVSFTDEAWVDDLRGLVDQMGDYVSPAAAKGSPFEASQPWFAPAYIGDNNEVVYLRTDEFSWRFPATYTVRNDSTVSVVWLGEKSDGTLLAWVKAEYNPQIDRFDHFVRGITSQGYEYQPSTLSLDGGEG